MSSITYLYLLMTYLKAKAWIQCFQAARVFFVLCSQEQLLRTCVKYLSNLVLGYFCGLFSHQNSIIMDNHGWFGAPPLGCECCNNLKSKFYLTFRHVLLNLSGDARINHLMSASIMHCDCSANAACLVGWRKGKYLLTMGSNDFSKGSEPDQRPSTLMARSQLNSVLSTC